MPSSNIGATEHHQFYGHSPSAVLATLATDLSGNANFTAGASYHIYRASFDYGEPYTVMVEGEVRWGSNPAGYVFSRYDGTTVQGIRYNGSTSFQLVLSNAVVQTVPMSVSEGETDTVTIHWSMDNDPVTGNMRSQFRVWDATGALLGGIDWSHTAPAVSGSDIIFGAQVTAGSNSAQFSLSGAGVLLHGIEGIQVFRDRLTASAAPTTDGDLAMEVPMPDWESLFGEQDRPVGPTHWIAAGAAKQNQLLLHSPLVNRVWPSADSISESQLDALAWWTETPGGSGYIGLPFVFRRPVPKNATHVKVRAFVSAGDSNTIETVTLGVSAWSANRNPGSKSATPLEANSDTQSFGPTNDLDTGAAGRWLDFDPIRIIRDESELWTWLYLSFNFTALTGTQSFFIVRAVTMEPMTDPTGDAIGGIGFG
jgi:hypothetical protein